MIEIKGNRAILSFTCFDLDSYDTFLKTKNLPESSVSYNRKDDTYFVSFHKRFVNDIVGNFKEDVSEYKFKHNEMLFDYQKHISSVALQNKRFNCYADTGLGKTIIFCDIAKNINNIGNKKILIVSPLEIINQTIEEAESKLNLNICRIDSKEDLKNFCNGSDYGVFITNYDKFIVDKKYKNESVTYLSNFLNKLDCIIFDESSNLKNYAGVLYNNIEKSIRGIEYRYTFTATPAPNSILEYMNQLKLIWGDNDEYKARFFSHFKRDKTGSRSLLPHATESFYKFMSNFSIYVKNPKNYGFKDNDVDLIPKPVIIEHRIDMTDDQSNELHKLNMSELQHGMFGRGKVGIVMRSKMSQIAKGFIYEKNVNKRFTRYINSLKPDFVSKLAIDEYKNKGQVLIWTVFDEEGSIIKSKLESMGQECEILTGKTSPNDRVKIIDGFRSGNIPILISKPSLIGFGLNLQMCKSMIFNGWDDSFERFYQAVRRAYRYGQNVPIRVHIPYIYSLEHVVLENIIKKKDNFNKDADEMEKSYINVLKKDGVLDENF